MGEYIEGSTSSLAITMADSSFGSPGRWTPEVGALMILSHAPGRLVNVTSRISVSALLDEGVTPPEAQALNLFNVSLVEDTSGERLDPGSGVVVCVGALYGSERRPASAPAPPASLPLPSPAPMSTTNNTHLPRGEL